MTFPIRIWNLVALTTMLSLAGCAVGPNYTVPADAEVNAPQAQASFVGAKGSAVVNEAAPAFGWWRLYNSPALDQLVEQGFVANTDLRVAAANLERSQAMVRAAQSQREVQVSFNAGVGRGLLSAEDHLSEARLPIQNLYDIGLGASYELDLFGRIQRGVEAAKADHEAVAAAQDWVRVTVAASITQAYLQVCSAGDELATARHSVELQAQGHSLTERLREGGRASRLDETRSRTLLDQLSATIAPLEARRKNALFQIATLTGEAPSQFDPQLANCVQVPPLTDAIPVGDGAALLRRRPDVRAAERQLASSTAQIGVATADLYPRVVLKASIGSTGVTSDFTERVTNDWLVGPFISWNINQSATRARISAATAAQKAQLARFDGVVLKALLEVETALNNYHQDLAREKALRTAAEDAKQAFADAHELQACGRAGALTTLDAERTLASSDQALAAVHAQLAQDQVALFMALGGGWEKSIETRLAGAP